MDTPLMWERLPGKIKNEICKTCLKERRRPGSAYGERCAARFKGLPVPDEIRQPQAEARREGKDNIKLSEKLKKQLSSLQNLKG